MNGSPNTAPYECPHGFGRECRNPLCRTMYGSDGHTPASPFACRLTDADLVRGCTPEQPETVEVGQRWMNVETGDTYPVASVRDDVIQRGERLVRLGTGSYVVLLSEADLRQRYVCTDAPDNVRALNG